MIVSTIVNLFSLVYTDIVLFQSRFKSANFQVYNNFLVNKNSLDYSGFNDTSSLYNEKLFLYKNVAVYGIKLYANVSLSECVALNSDEIIAINEYYKFFNFYFFYTCLMQLLILIPKWSLSVMKLNGLKAKNFLILF